MKTKSPLLFGVIATLIPSAFCASAVTFDGDWRGAVKTSEGEKLALRIVIAGNEATQYFAGEDGRGWEEVKPARSTTSTLNDTYVVTWLNQGGVWTEHQTFSLSYVSPSKLNVVWMRHVTNREQGKDGRPFNVSGAGELARVDASVDWLIKAAAAGDAAEVRQLLSKGADVNARNEAGQTALMAAAARHPHIVRLLLDAGAGLNAKDSDGDTPLIYAALTKNTEAVKLLVQKGANLNAKGEKGKTALIHACETGMAEIATLLLERGAAVDAPDGEGDTALMYACYGGKADLARLLIQHGADPNARNAKGTKPLGAVRIGNRSSRAKLSMLGGDYADPKFQNNPALDDTFQAVADLLRKAGARE